jgi:hypothetical protein
VEHRDALHALLVDEVLAEREQVGSDAAGEREGALVAQLADQGR